MEMRAGCRLPRSGLFPLNLNLNLGRRSQSLGWAVRGWEQGCCRPRAPTLEAGGVPRHPEAFVPCPGGSQRVLLSFKQKKCWKVPSQRCVCSPCFHGTSRHEVTSGSPSPPVHVLFHKRKEMSEICCKKYGVVALSSKFNRASSRGKYGAV